MAATEHYINPRKAWREILETTWATRVVGVGPGRGVALNCSGSMSYCCGVVAIVSIEEISERDDQ
jgi:hypothetical protein